MVSKTSLRETVRGMTLPLRGETPAEILRRKRDPAYRALADEFVTG
jgi:hypothetical protein